jgi:hypothetical protein
MLRRIPAVVINFGGFENRVAAVLGRKSGLSFSTWNRTSTVPIGTRRSHGREKHEKAQKEDAKSLWLFVFFVANKAGVSLPALVWGGTGTHLRCD